MDRLTKRTVRKNRATNGIRKQFGYVALSLPYYERVRTLAERENRKIGKQLELIIDAQLPPSQQPPAQA